MAEGSGRSRSRRIAGSWPARIVSEEGPGGREWRAETISNLSTSGFYFVSSAEYPIGGRLLAQIEIGEKGRLLAQVEVVRKNETPAGLSGYGARFVAMGAEDVTRLGEFITERHQAELAMNPETRKEQPSYRVRRDRAS
jgi:hypothetical protein